jgi:hypothetical protein
MNNQFETALKTKGTKVVSILKNMAEFANFVHLYQSKTLTDQPKPFDDKLYIKN